MPVVCFVADAFFYFFFLFALAPVVINSVFFHELGKSFFCNYDVGPITKFTWRVCCSCY